MHKFIQYKSIVRLGITLWLMVVCSSCGKEFLEKKYDKSQLVPNNLEEFRALLNRAAVDGASTELGTNGGDEFYLTDLQFNSISIYMKHMQNAYLWEKEVYELFEVGDWDRAYMHILYTNLILNRMQALDPAQNTALYNHVKGGALFIRSYRYYQLLQTFCKEYDPLTASTDLGLPIRLDYDPEAIVKRSSVQEVYTLIEKDLKEAVSLLNDKDEFAFYEPGKAAAHFMLAKMYMHLGKFELVAEHASKALETHHLLLDYNTIDVNANLPFQTLINVARDRTLNPEIIFQKLMHGPYSGNEMAVFHPNKANVDTVLLAMYDDRDLRKEAYFGPHAKDIDRIVYKGTYTGSISAASTFFAGLATDELYLIRAEAYARLDKIELAMEDLNYLLKHRIHKDYFSHLVASTSEDALDLILRERRKELVFRGTRWEDLRRLNKEARYETTLVRIVNGVKYELKPKDNRWVWPLPEDEIEFGGVEQNPR